MIKPIVGVAETPAIPAVDLSRPVGQVTAYGELKVDPLLPVGAYLYAGEQNARSDAWIVARTEQTAPAVTDSSAADADRKVEAEIVPKGLTSAPRVTPAKIDALMARVVYTFDERPNGSTATLCNAFLDGKFYLATGLSNCVSPENYDPEVGRKIAQENAARMARKYLWEFEGYALHKQLSNPPVLTINGPVSDEDLERIRAAFNANSTVVRIQAPSVVIEGALVSSGEVWERI